LFAIKYYRTEQAAQLYRDHGVTDKPAGWVRGRLKYLKHRDAQRDADTLIDRGVAAEVIPLNELHKAGVK